MFLAPSPTLKARRRGCAKVAVMRVKTRAFDKSHIIGINKKIFLDHAFEIKNNLKIPIHIELVDQVPLSRNSDMAVGITETSKANRDENTGRLSR